MLPSNVVELKIFSCPLQMEMECSQRLDCKPIPGAGSSHPKFIVVGLNPGARKGVWCQYKSLGKLKRSYLQECFALNHEYGKFLIQLEKIIPDFSIPRTVYLTDIVKCPTVRNENPSESMVKKCYSAYWENMVQTLHPDYIIGLGSKVAKIIGGFNRNGKKVLSDRISIGNNSYWFISAPHPRYKTVYQLRTIALEIKSVLEEPEKYIVEKKVSPSKEDVSLRRAEIEKQLAEYGYQKLNKKISKGDRRVNLVVSKDYGVRTRIYWREKWKDDFAVIYDYKLANGPTCIVPMKALFETNYVKNKRKDYGESKDWWSGTYAHDHELTRLILGYKDKWDILK